MMKTNGKASKALALCLALLMAIGLFGTTAFALGQNDTGNITVSGVENGVAVSAYRLMDVKINANGQPQEPVYTWVSAIAGWVRDNYSDYIGKEETDNSVQSAFSTAEADAIAVFYDALAAAIKDGSIPGFPAAVTENAANGGATLSNLAMGNYLILIENGYRVYRPSAVNLVPEWKDGSWQMTAPAAVVVKSSEPTISKTVKADGTAAGQEKDNASIGDTVTFEIVADVPQFPANALAKNYAISDKLPDGLKLTAGSLEVYGLKGEEDPVLLKANDAYTQETARPGGKGTSTFTLTFDYDKISGYDQIRVEYTAMLTDKAVLGATGNVNTAYLDYSNDPYVKDSLTSQDDSATVYTYGLDISKVDKKNTATLLAGAEFELYASLANATVGENKISFVREEDGVYRVATQDDDAENKTTTLAVGADEAVKGKLIIKGLDAGKWYLKETKAPGGYNLLASPVEVEIVDADDAGALDGQVEGAAADAIGAAVALVTLQVANDNGFQLPTTGGIGTILFTAVGVVLMGAAVVLVIVAFKKKRAEN